MRRKTQIARHLFLFTGNATQQNLEGLSMLYFDSCLMLIYWSLVLRNGRKETVRQITQKEKKFEWSEKGSFVRENRSRGLVESSRDTVLFMQAWETKKLQACGSSCNWVDHIAFLMRTCISSPLCWAYRRPWAWLGAGSSSSRSAHSSRSGRRLGRNWFSFLIYLISVWV